MAAWQQPRAFNWNNASARVAESCLQILLKCGIEKFGEPCASERYLFVCDFHGCGLVGRVGGERRSALEAEQELFRRERKAHRCSANSDA
jgi:hypothetical protein